MINVVIAITIATIKASLVALFFMHLLHEKPINALIFLISAFMLGLLLILCYIDYESRDHITPPNYKGEVPAGRRAAPPAPAPAGAPAAAEEEHH